MLPMWKIAMNRSPELRVSNLSQQNQPPLYHYRKRGVGRRAVLRACWLAHSMSGAGGDDGLRKSRSAAGNGREADGTSKGGRAQAVRTGPGCSLSGWRGAVSGRELSARRRSCPAAEKSRTLVGAQTEARFRCRYARWKKLKGPHSRSLAEGGVGVLDGCGPRRWECRKSRRPMHGRAGSCNLQFQQSSPRIA
ncbi:uncharacterized protein BDR25DRAFT_94603 [Lindgomyces ingoldianus]|uniref:Uncharacterized protein n=1 Tax=Lindgomyces ingoldianus TaxID=673940 RepID=A0ACB6QEU9_9PLEO|nr:uncharacterized protein BDR25DRAFT_94603 [Lindgomyces ingoldianus]KAF2464675.1 hypothetical protein BDR25DRAFT_94603 [Lindgomyces ingoldianus]